MFFLWFSPVSTETWFPPDTFSFFWWQWLVGGGGSLVARFFSFLLVEKLFERVKQMFMWFKINVYGFNKKCSHVQKVFHVVQQQ